MKNPKTFSRKLDSLLNRIGEEDSHESFISSIIDELVSNFGKDLKIANGCIYDLRGDSFLLVYALNKDPWRNEIDAQSSIIKAVRKHNSYIFDDPDQGNEFARVSDFRLTPAAVKIDTPEQQLLIVFGLNDGWIREEISLFINAFQMALSFRLFSDIMDSEIEEAAQIQQSLLPKSDPKFPGYDIAGKSIPAVIVGGDFYEYFESDEGFLGLSIGDASGHGIPAALLVRDVVVGLRMGLASRFKLTHIVNKLNTVIQRNTVASNFVSLILGEFEKNGHFFYVNAGHPSPFIVQGDHVEELKTTGTVIGFLKDLEVQRDLVQLQKGSIMVMYTDGIVERVNSDSEQYTKKRLQKLLMENKHYSADEIIDIIYQDVYKFGGAVNWKDDATVVVIKRL